MHKAKMSKIVILCSFSFFLIDDVSGRGPGDGALEEAFANTYDQKLFKPATSSMKTRCIKAWSRTYGRSDTIKQVQAWTGQSQKIEFTDFDHDPITTTSLVHCLIHSKSKKSFIKKGIETKGVSMFWLSEKDEHGLTYILKKPLATIGTEGAPLNVIDMLDLSNKWYEDPKITGADSLFPDAK